VKARLARNPVIQETGAPRREIYRGGGLTDKFNRTRVRLSILVISSEAEKSHSILLKRTVRDVSVRARRGTSVQLADQSGIFARSATGRIRRDEQDSRNCPPAPSGPL